jgi:hypothetical protein
MDNKKCKKWDGQLRELRGKHAEFRQAYADALQFAEQNPGVRETAFGGCRVLFGEIKVLVLALREDFPRLKLAKFLEKDYVKMRGTLEHYEISTDGMPSWEQVKKGLTREVLDKALKLLEPTLLLVPPTTRQSKVEAINKHPAKGQTENAFMAEFDDNDLWNGGSDQTETRWRVFIVEGVQNMAQDDEICDGSRKNFEMVKLWVKKFEKEGLDVINDADTYLTLMMKGLAEEKPMDPNTTNTVLNGINLKEGSVVVTGGWVDGVTLGFDDPVDVFNDLRLRGLVRVDVPETV